MATTLTLKNENVMSNDRIIAMTDTPIAMVWDRMHDMLIAVGPAANAQIHAERMRRILDNSGQHQTADHIVVIGAMPTRETITVFNHALSGLIPYARVHQMLDLVASNQI